MTGQTEVAPVEVLPLEIGAPWTLPRHDGAGHLGVVAHANDRLRRDAQRRLSRVLPSLGDTTGWDVPHPSEPCRIDADLGVTTLDVGDILDTLVAVEDADSGRISSSGTGRPEHLGLGPAAVHPRQHPTLSPRRLHAVGLAASLHAGRSLIFNHSDDIHPVLASLAVDVGRAFRGQVSVNAYLSIGGSDGQGFGGHWDEQDVIAIPLIGEKRWEIAPPLQPAPLLVAVPQGHTDQLATSLTLAPGQALVLPRGWTHRVTQDGSGTSFHLTIGLIRPRGPAVAAQLAERLLRHASFRSDVDIDSSPDEWERMGRSMATGPEIEAAAALVVARMGSRHFDSLDATLAYAQGDRDGLWVEPTAPSALVVQSDLDRQGRVVLGLDNRALAVVPGLLTEVVELLSGPPCPLADDAEVLDTLLHAGLLTVTQGAPRSWIAEPATP